MELLPPEEWLTTAVKTLKDDSPLPEWHFTKKRPKDPRNHYKWLKHREIGWDTTTRKYTPLVMKGLKPVTFEPWADDTLYFGLPMKGTGAECLDNPGGGPWDRLPVTRHCTPTPEGNASDFQGRELQRRMTYREALFASRLKMRVMREARAEINYDLAA